MQLSDYKSMEAIHKGWSNDQKYCVTREDGGKYLLRISDKDSYEKKKLDYEFMKQVAELGVPMCQALDFGSCEEGSYLLQSWIDGDDVESVITSFTDTKQYVYGRDAGEILKKIHSIPAPDTQEEWEPRFNRKIDKKIKNYKDCPIHYKDNDAFLTYIEENRHLLKNRPQSYQHGDYHIGNMMIEKGQLTIIDFDRCDFGDPWEEFNRIVWCAQKSPLFASGMVDGYFGGRPPMDFWKLLALYIASNTLSSIYWAIEFGQQEIDTMINQAKKVLSWYHNMQNPIPTWYTENFYVQELDGLMYKLKEPYDFGFLSRYGKVVQIFDDQDSGNICFGIRNGEEDYFVKFAGAQTEQYSGTPMDAINRLKATVPIYQELQHHTLVEFIKAEDVGGGFAMLFRWTKGECMGRMYPQSRQKFLQMPVSTKRKLFNDIISFFIYFVSKGYVGIDFYDGSIMYEFMEQRTIICDIDFFRKQPCINDMGRMWGSSRFQAPEEYKLGAPIDEITNVYTLGATAFALFSEYDRSREAWPLDGKLYEVAIQAVSDDRNLRQQSIVEFKKQWEACW